MSRLPPTAAQIVQVRRRIDAAFAQLDSALFSAGPRIADRALSVSPWSPLDVAEHVTLANRFLLVLAEKCARKSVAKHARGEVPDHGGTDLDALDRLAHRDFHWEVPAHMVPQGRLEFADVRRTLAQQHAHAMALLDMVPAQAVGLHTIRMTFIGPAARLDLHELLALVAGHAARHAAQVDRIVHARADGHRH